MMPNRVDTLMTKIPRVKAITQTVNRISEAQTPEVILRNIFLTEVRYCVLHLIVFTLLT